MSCSKPPGRWQWIIARNPRWMRVKTEVQCPIPEREEVASQWLRTSKRIRKGRETTEGTNHVAKSSHPPHVAGWSSGQREQTHYKPEAISSPDDWCSHTLHRRCALPLTFPQVWYSSLLDFSLPPQNPTLWETLIPWSPRRRTTLTLLIQCPTWPLPPHSRT